MQKINNPISIMLAEEMHQAKCASRLEAKPPLRSIKYLTFFFEKVCDYFTLIKKQLF
jgi:hypothetical protein